MEVLILSCGTGGGHNAAGQAIAEELDRRGHHAVMLDPYTLHSDKLAKRIDDIYLFAAKKAPTLFGAVYQVGNLYRRLPFRSPVYFANRSMASILRKYLDQNHYDIIMTPHLFPAEIITYMRNHHMNTPKAMFIATDYTCIPFTEETTCDAYVIPAADLAPSFAGRGLPSDKLYPLGIPVRKQFLQAISHEEARKQLGLALDKQYVLIAGGSMGGGRIRKAIRLLIQEIGHTQNVELVVICGSNRRLQSELESAGVRGVTVLGFTKDMALWIKAADLFITKPGGLSSTEAAVSGVPLVQMAAIPGCEIYNARYFSSHGMSRKCDTTVQGLRSALELLEDASARHAMEEKQRELMPKNAAADICDLAERMVSG